MRGWCSDLRAEGTCGRGACACDVMMRSASEYGQGTIVGWFGGKYNEYGYGAGEGSVSARR